MDRDEIRGVCIRESSEVSFCRGKGRRRGIMKYAAALVAAAIALLAFLCFFGFSDEILNSLGGIEPSGGDNGGLTAEIVATDVKTEAMESTVAENESKSETEIEESDETEAAVGVPDVCEKDLSLAERGDSYLINYTGKAVDAEGLLEIGFSGGRYSYTEQPVVMILHTHTSEGYYDLDPTKAIDAITKSVVAVGEAVATELNKRGIPTIHCTVIHDGEGQDPYTSAAETIETMLKIYPTIEYIIDLHRMTELDGGENVIRPLSTDGKAQLRVTVSGGGRRVRETLSLALCLRRELNSGGRRLCMPTVFTDNKYNSTLSRYYLKVDVGSYGNLAAEAVAAGESFAEAFASVLKK